MKSKQFLRFNDTRRYSFVSMRWCLLQIELKSFQHEACSGVDTEFSHFLRCSRAQQLSVKLLQPHRTHTELLRGHRGVDDELHWPHNARSGYSEPCAFMMVCVADGGRQEEHGDDSWRQPCSMSRLASMCGGGEERQRGVCGGCGAPRSLSGFLPWFFGG